MLPVAITCPVWWVARWMARMVTSLAVVLACSLGAAAMPGDAAGPVRAAPAAGAVASVPGERADPAPIARAASGSVEVDVTGAVDRSVPSVGGSVPAAQPAMVVPTGRQPVLVGLTPATLGSRAPPAR